MMRYLSATLLAACALLAGVHAVSAQLADSRWLVEDIGGRGVIDNLQTTIEFRAGGRAAGNAGCNRWMASWTAGGPALAFTAAATTRKACLPAVADQERRFLAALAGVKTFRFDILGFLVLADASGAELMRASRRQ